MLEELPKWIIASVAQHFENYNGDVRLLIETEYDDTKLLTDAYYLFVDGPVFTETTKGKWFATFQLICLVSTKVDEENLYRHVENIGRISLAFTPTISIFKYGSGVADDHTIIGCAEQVNENGATIIISHFGKSPTNKDVRVAQVLSYYEFEFST